MAHDKQDTAYDHYSFGYSALSRKCITQEPQQELDRVEGLYKYDSNDTVDDASELLLLFFFFFFFFFFF